MVLFLVCSDLKGTFVEEPMDSWVVKGGRVSLACSPPPGYPAPKLAWAQAQLFHKQILTFGQGTVIKWIHGCFTHLRIVHQTVGPVWMNHLMNCPVCHFANRTD